MERESVSGKERTWIEVKENSGEKSQYETTGAIKKKDVHGQTLKEPPFFFFVRTMFSRNISIIFQKSFYHVLLLIGEITAKNIG